VSDDAATGARLDGRVALVTGAGRGFGQAIAHSLAAAGADVAVNYRASATGAEEVAAAVRANGRRALVVQGDVAREDDVKRLVEATREQLGRLDILVNNAGVMLPGSFLEIPVSRYDEMFAINVRGTMLCTWHALPAMIERRWGRVINLSSQLAHLGAVAGIGFAAYAATKGAVTSFTRAIAREFGHYGITVNAVAPGSIDTDMSRAIMTPEFKARRIKELPAGRMGSVEDVAHVVRFLASEESGFLTGQVLHPSGGLVMG
jgi:3-oxoacyl-[acyl-carrier protein] reductase